MRQIKHIIREVGMHKRDSTLMWIYVCNCAEDSNYLLNILVTMVSPSGSALDVCISSRSTS